MKMNQIIAASAMALALTGVAARADLLLSGSTAGFFHANANPNTVIDNTPNGLTASFRTGVPLEGSFQSGVRFNGNDFAGVSNGDTFSLGLLTYYNGITQIGTSSGTALLDFYLDLDDPAGGQVFLTTITFGVDATINNPPDLIPDVFTASFTQPSAVMIGDQLVKFTINGLPASTELDEDDWTDLASVTVTYLNPVPEPATYGLFGALGLAGLAAFRRIRGKRSRNPAQPLAA